MMPIKDILAMRPKTPKPPVLVIDETTIRNTKDAGPVCGCHEMYDYISSYKPFVPGGTHPYMRRNIPDSECFDIVWKPVRIGSCEPVFDIPVAIHQEEMPENYSLSKEFDENDLMFVSKPRYSEAYYLEKLRECQRVHVEGCHCPV